MDKTVSHNLRNFAKDILILSSLSDITEIPRPSTISELSIKLEFSTNINNNLNVLQGLRRDLSTSLLSISAMSICFTAATILATSSLHLNGPKLDEVDPGLVDKCHHHPTTLHFIRVSYNSSKQGFSDKPYDVLGHLHLQQNPYHDG